MLMETQRRMCLILTVIIICCGLTFGQNSRPNIVFVLADDLGWDDVGFHGSRQIPTPNLDALAYDGIILANYYVQPLCTPSRAALMTGRYPIRYGLQQGVIVSAQPYGLPLNETIFPQFLKRFGYATHIVGKWHLGFFTEDYTPNRRGFDSFYGYYSGMEDYFDHTYAAGWPDRKGWGYDFRRNAELEKATFGQYSTELFTREAEKIIANHNTSQPLFLYLPHQAVHSSNPVRPLEAPAKYVNKVSHIKTRIRQLYAAMMSALDDSVGNVTRALHQRGMLNNTIIIFSTDNGGPADGFDFNDASNWPLRGLKSTLWEGGVRGAGFIWSPLLRRSRYTSHHLMHITDWFPTLMHAVTADSDSFSLPQNLDGLDQWDALSDNLKSRRSEILHNINPGVDAAAVRMGDMKLVSALHGSTRSYDDWYPTDNCQTKLHGTVVNDPFLKAFYQTDTADKVNMTIVRDKYQPETFHFINNSRPKFTNNGKIRPAYLSEVAPPQHSELISILEEIGRKPVYPEEPFSVKCGPRPENASTNCKPWLQACLFNVTADPCEYENLALTQPHVVAALQKRVEFYKEHAVPPIDKPVDDAGLPYHHDGYWVPWIKAVSPSLRDDGK